MRNGLTVNLLSILLSLNSIIATGFYRYQPELPLTIYILYFDQSSPKLRPGVKTTLDSIARQLVEKPVWLATVTGYTDDIGKRELNMVLAEKRAKAVANYLKQRGVPASQVVVTWEGPDKNAPVENAETAKTISRRVVILLSPR